MIVTAALPLEVTVTDFATAVPTETLPNDSDVALKLNAGTVAFSCSTKLAVDPFTPTEIIAVCEVVTEATFAVNDAVDAPDATTTLFGTAAALLFVVMVTLRPPDGAAELSPTVQAVVPAPVNELVPQEKALTVGDNGAPEPPRLIVVDFETDPCVADRVTVWELSRLTRSQ